MLTRKKEHIDLQTAINSWLRIYSQMLTLPSLLFSLTFMPSPCPVQSTGNHIFKTIQFKTSSSSAQLVTNKRQLWQTKRWPSGLEHWLPLPRTRFQFPVLTQWLTTVCSSRARRSDTSSLHLNLHAHPDLYTDTRSYTAATRRVALQTAQSSLPDHRIDCPLHSPQHDLDLSCKANVDR